MFTELKIVCCFWVRMYIQILCSISPNSSVNVSERPSKFIFGVVRVVNDYENKHFCTVFKLKKKILSDFAKSATTQTLNFRACIFAQSKNLVKPENLFFKW